MTPPDVRRFVARVRIGDSPLDCWLWAGGKRHSYGVFCIDGGTVSAHRFAYELFVGEIPEGLHVDHLCREPACVNPAHLEAVTLGENTRRGLRGRLRVRCAQGHLYTPENTGVWKGHRYCRSCKRTRTAERDKRRIRARVDGRIVEVGLREVSS